MTRSFVEATVPAGRARRLFGRPGHGRVPAKLRKRVREVLIGSALGGSSGSTSASSSSPLHGGRTDSDLDPPHIRTGTPSGCDLGRAATFSYEPQGPVAGPAFTPNQIEGAYGATPLHRSGVNGHGVRVAIYGAGGVGRRELSAYAACFGFRAPPVHLVKVGTKSPGPTSAEEALDLQMVSLMAPGVRGITAYEIGSGFFAAGFSAMLDPREAPGGHRPDVISVSQGDCETAFSRSEVHLTEYVLAAAAAAGVTVAAGSGDNGSFCPDGPNRAFYPSASPWATSVGGTSLTLTPDNAIADEIPWNDRSFAPMLGLGGGGGFGRVLDRPPYQHDLGDWGRRRGYPDVSLYADSFPGIAIYCKEDSQGNCLASAPGNPFKAGFGTSAATPMFAGIVALADQRLLARGRPPLGFVNPLLYRLGRSGGGGVLRDITEGSNSALWPTCCDAAPGYDLASGWGSVNAERLAAIALRRGPR